MEQPNFMFLDQFEEKADFNQYWYSKRTITKIVEEAVHLNCRTAYLSTPSLYFALPAEVKDKSFVYDYDTVWSDDRGYVKYDFNAAEVIPAEHLGTFDLVVIDPPFITEEVWRKYAVTAQLLLRKGVDENGLPAGKVILTTIAENEPLLRELFGASSTAFQPSIPNLVYQYNLFTNYPSKIFAQTNPEIP